MRGILSPLFLELLFRPSRCAGIDGCRNQSPAAFLNGLPKEVFDLAVHAAQLILSPCLEFRPQSLIDAQKKGLSFPHDGVLQVYSVPALMTGCTSDSAQSTTIRLLTIAA